MDKQFSRRRFWVRIITILLTLVFLFPMLSALFLGESVLGSFGIMPEKKAINKIANVADSVCSVQKLLYYVYDDHPLVSPRKSHLEQALPPLISSHLQKEIAPMLEALSSEYTRVSVTKVPAYSQLAYSCAADKDWWPYMRRNIATVVRKQKAWGYELSYQLYHGYWLNIHLSRITHTVFMKVLLFIIEFFMALIAILYLWATERFWVPWRNINQSAKALGIDLKQHTVPAVGPGLVRDAANTMERMTERINQLVKERTATIAALSHDIRTPLTRAKLYAQVMEGEQTQKIIRQLDEIEYLVQNTLDYARQDHQAEAKKKIDLVSLVRSLCDDMVDVGHVVSFDTACQRAVISGQFIGLKRVFQNILSNAIKYGAVAHVKVDLQSRSVFVLVSDEGPGLPEAQLKHVFKPFYRYEKSRSRATGGTGLGLAIAKSIVTSNEGLISLRNGEQGGLAVMVSFPLVTPLK